MCKSKNIIHRSFTHNYPSFQVKNTIYCWHVACARIQHKRRRIKVRSLPSIQCDVCCIQWKFMCATRFIFHPFYLFFSSFRLSIYCIKDIMLYMLAPSFEYKTKWIVYTYDAKKNLKKRSPFKWEKNTTTAQHAYHKTKIYIVSIKTWCLLS